MNDKYGRNINYLRISVTDVCNLRCKYCMPENVSFKDDIMTTEEIVKIVKSMAKLGITKVRLTGGEPLIRSDILILIREIKKISKIKEITMTTNGIFLKKMAFELKEAGLDRVNISIDTFDLNKYHDISGGNLSDVLEGIKEAKRVGLNPVKFNVVLIGGFNDDEIESFVNYTINNDVDVRFIELMPIGNVANWTKEKFISNNVVLEKFPKLKEVDCLDSSSPSKYYKLEGSKGKIGLINPITCKFCSNCNRIRLTSEGKIKPCLHSNFEVDILKLLRNNANIDKIIEKIIFFKPKEHKLDKKNYIPVFRDMNSIGG